MSPGEPFDAFHLPVPVDGPFRTLQAGRLSCRYPEPTAALVARVAGRLAQAGRALAGRPVADLIGAVDAAAARLADPADELGARARSLLPPATGYARPMVELILERMTRDWRADRLRRLVEVEVGGEDALDGWTRRDDAALTMALGPRLAFHVFAGNVPGVAVTSLVRTLLVKGPSLGKLAAGEPVLPVLFARALESVDPALAASVALTYWPGGEQAPEEAAIAAADTLVVYGGAQAVAALGARRRPEQRIVLHGPKLSIAAIGRGPLEGGLEGAARRAARAVATFDQQGCVSPHAVWVEGTHDRAAAAAEWMARELARLEAALPRGEIGTAEASAIHQERGAAEMRAQDDPRVRVLAGPGTSWTVVLEPGEQVRPSCLNRFVRVHPIPDLMALPDRLAPLAPHLQSVALEGAGERDLPLAARLAREGATRVTTLDRLPWPPPAAHHDGAPPLRELIRWTDRET